MSKLIKELNKYGLAILLVIALPALWSLLYPGFYGASDEVHIAWLFEMHRALLTGQIPPRFVPDLSFGFGYPLFNFVFPLPFYIGELFHLLGFSLVDSIKSVFLISLPLSAIAMYFLLRKFVAPILSLAGSVIYIYTPYRSTDIYIRGAIGEIFSFVFFPLATLSILNLISSEDKKSFNLRWIGLGGLSVGGLILTHDIAAFMFLPFLAILAVGEILFVSKCKRVDILQMIASLCFGLLISLYFWLPALFDSKLFKYDTVFNFEDHFPTLKQLLTPYFGYGASVPGPYDGISFFIGSLNLTLVVIALPLLALHLRKFGIKERVILAWALVSFFTTVLMMNFRSAPLWHALPYLPYFQFPWRFLMITTFVTPILVVGLNRLRFNLPLGIALAILACALNFSFFRPQDFLGRGDVYFLNKYIPYPKASPEYLRNQEEYLRLPAQAVKRPDQKYPSVFGDHQGVSLVNQINSLDSEIITDSPSNFLLSYNKYFFPGWEAIIDGVNTEIKPALPFGQISVLVPAGKHDLIIRFRETSLKRILDICSLLGFIISVWLIAKKRYNYR